MMIDACFTIFFTVYFLFFSSSVLSGHWEGNPRRAPCNEPCSDVERTLQHLNQQPCESKSRVHGLAWSHGHLSTKFVVSKTAVNLSIDCLT